MGLDGFDPDLIFVIGMVVAVLSVPALLSAWTHGERPRHGAIMVMIAAGLILIATLQKPGGYSLGEAPQVFASVVGRAVN